MTGLRVLIAAAVALLTGCGSTASTATPRVDGGSPSPTATPSPSATAALTTTTPTAGPTAGWVAVHNVSGRFTLYRPADLQAVSCDPGSATGLTADLVWVGPIVPSGVCRTYEGWQAAMVFQSQEAGSSGSAVPPAGCGGPSSSEDVTVDGVAGTRTVTGPTTDSVCMGPTGQVDVTYRFSTGGRAYLFDFHRSPSDPDLTAVFDEIVRSVVFG